MAVVSAEVCAIEDHLLLRPVKARKERIRD